jgi:hypothetical protein
MAQLYKRFSDDRLSFCYKPAGTNSCFFSILHTIDPVIVCVIS